MLGFALAAAAWAAGEAKLMSPPDNAWFAEGPVRVVARGEGARIEFDGDLLQAEERFPGVWEAQVEAPSAGEHTVALVVAGERLEAHIAYGPEKPQGYEAFRSHPGMALECAQCHGVSRRGRFRFNGDCFQCHTNDQYSAKHPHPKHVLERCGDCHNPHGETATALLSMPKETACRLCHGL